MLLFLKSGGDDGRDTRIFARLRSGERVSVGRADAADLTFADDDFLSRIHCEIVATNDGGFVRDLDSKNGTALNGIRTTLSRLRDGDQIVAGATVFLVRISVDGQNDVTSGRSLNGPSSSPSKEFTISETATWR